MITHIVLNLLNDMRICDTMRGLPSILSPFHDEFNEFDNTRARILYSIYHTIMSLRLL